MEYQTFTYYTGEKPSESSGSVAKSLQLFYKS